MFDGGVYVFESKVEFANPTSEKKKEKKKEDDASMNVENLSKTYLNEFQTEYWFDTDPSSRSRGGWGRSSDQGMNNNKLSYS